MKARVLSLEHHLHRRLVQVDKSVLRNADGPGDLKVHWDRLLEVPGEFELAAAGLDCHIRNLVVVYVIPSELAQILGGAHEGSARGQDYIPDLLGSDRRASRWRLVRLYLRVEAG